MITVEEAKKYFPKDQVPTDDEIRQALVSMYGVANREYELMVEEQLKENDGDNS
jgi:hypothetical protein